MINKFICKKRVVMESEKIESMGMKIHFRN